MEVLVAPKAGFCFGVERAIDMARQTANEKSGPIYTLGPIIHNRQVVEKLASEGIQAITNFRDIPPGNLIIRSHGVGPEVLKAADEYGHTVIDATCPFVRKAQELARDYTAEGYQVVVVGDKEHPEVKGIVGWTGGSAIVVDSAAEAEKISGFNRVAVVAQTTQPVEIYNEVVQALQNKGFKVEAGNTICRATGERQKAALELAQKVDVMIVVGGVNSANTGKLTKLCSAAGTPTYQVETAAELKADWFAGVERAGLTAGASTPSWVIEEVKCRMKELGETMEMQEEGMREAVEVKTLHQGETVRGTVVQVNQDEVLVDVGAKSEGVIPLKELSSYNTNPQEVVKVGDEIDVVVLKAEDDEGRTLLSKVRADIEKNWDSLEEAMNNGTVIEGVVREVVKGGLLVDVGIRAFLPASLVEIGYVEDLSQYLNQTIKAKIIEMNKNRRKVILSRKVVLEEEAEKAREELFQTLEEGQTVKGVVRRLTDFGAFIDIGGVDGLLHISEMAWYRIKHPSEVVNVGDEVEVKVLKIDKENQKVSLGLKQLLPNPWDNVEEKYEIGSVVPAKVVRLAPFGAFVQLEPGVEGLVHISHLAEEHVEKPEDVVSEGDEINVKVLSVDREEKRIRLSIREVNREAKKERSKPKKQAGKPEPREQQETVVEADTGGGVSLAEVMPKELTEMLEKNR
ncbi:4-hydroxy-3-methylbut-2-enyl diphosphate reductase [Desulfohalotomaculum tongense]|uniref:bifunctional 4-hydroxy-3-methylbut-2-enyl diphosphate reductase/30S ribosomal protein S1 n=1 Tax=Desulforadius tongensis TaxID=1216062 RepID=UPI00195EEA77|nr:bifunctional 4-hydroxy-3-methylbut-2-enyl diphosphate reductase/30S ribosomal protein S1 [Desulforadius tongensis]MBM7854641.1 4-hydroxy-3-methylbut-2-enyl diphosphate reductase [Desulforadius tongensis]